MMTYKIRQAKWPSKLYPALHRKALEVYHQILLAHSNSYDAIKRIFLLLTGITPEGKLQEMMSKPPPSNQTAVGMLGHFRNNSCMVKPSICWTLTLEFTYKYAAKHIVSFVRSLHLAEPLNSAIERDQKISSRHCGNKIIPMTDH